MEDIKIPGNPMAINPDGFNIDNQNNKPSSISIEGGNDFMSTLIPKEVVQYGDIDISSHIDIPKLTRGLGEFKNNKGSKSSNKPVTVNYDSTIKGSNIGQHELGIYGKYVGGKVTEGVDLQEFAGQKQTGWETWARGLGKFAISAGQAFTEPFVDMLYGAPAAIVCADKELFYDNGVTNWMDKVAADFSKNNPIFQTNAEKNANLMSMETLGSDAFWSDQALGSFGFTVGTILNGMVTGGLLTAAGKATQAGKAANMFERFMASYTAEGATLTGKAKTLDTIIAGMNTARTKTAIARTGLSMFSAFGEAGLEARQINNTLKPKLDALVENGDISAKEAEETLTSAKNMVFGMNTLTVGASQYVQFGKLFTRGYTAERAAIGKIGLNAETKTFEKLGGKYNWMYNTATRAITEGNEEMLQNMYQHIAENQYVGRKNGKTFVRDGVGASIEAIAKGLSPAFSNAWNSKDGQTSIFLGAVMGVLGGAHEIVRDQRNTNKATTLAVNTLNSYITGKDNAIYTYIKHIGDQAAIGQALEKSASKKDKFTYKNYEDQSLIKLVGALQATNSFGVFENYLNDVLSMNVDEYQKLNTGTTDNHYVVANKDALAVDILSNAKIYKTLYDTIQNNFSDRTPEHRETLYELKAATHGLDVRKAKITNSLKEKTGVDYEDTYKLAQQELVAKYKKEYNATLGKGKINDPIQEGKFIRNKLNESDILNHATSIYNDQTAKMGMDEDSAAEIKDLEKINNVQGNLVEYFKHLSSKEGFADSNINTIKTGVNTAVADIKKDHKEAFKTSEKSYDEAFKKKATIETVAKATQDVTNTNEGLKTALDRLDKEHPSYNSKAAVYSRLISDNDNRLKSLEAKKIALENKVSATGNEPTKPAAQPAAKPAAKPEDGVKPVNPVITNTIKKISTALNNATGVLNSKVVVQKIDDETFDSYVDRINGLKDTFLAQRSLFTTDLEENVIIDNLTDTLDKINTLIGELHKASKAKVVKTNTKSLVEAEKVDIERRRQEDLDYNKSLIEETAELWKDDEDRYFIISTMKDGKKRVIVSDENGKRYGVAGEYPKENTDNSKLLNNGVKIDLDVNLKSDKRTSKINAKYDAELAKLNTEPVVKPVVKPVVSDKYVPSAMTLKEKQEFLLSLSDTDGLVKNWRYYSKALHTGNSNDFGYYYNEARTSINNHNVSTDEADASADAFLKYVYEHKDPILKELQDRLAPKMIITNTNPVAKPVSQTSDENLVKILDKSFEEDPEGTLRAMFNRLSSNNDKDEVVETEVVDNVSEISNTARTTNRDEAIDGASRAHVTELLFNNEGGNGYLAKQMAKNAKDFNNPIEVIGYLETLLNNGEKLDKQQFAELFTPYYQYVFNNFENAIANDLFDNQLTFPNYESNDALYQDYLNPMIVDSLDSAPDEIIVMDKADQVKQKTPWAKVTTNYTEHNGAVLSVTGAAMNNINTVYSGDTVDSGATLVMTIDNEKPNFSITKQLDLNSKKVTTEVISNEDVLAKVRAGDWENITEEEIINMPIKVSDSAGAELGHLHNPAWLDENRSTFDSSVNTNDGIAKAKRNLFEYKLAVIIHAANHNGAPIRTKVEFSNSGFITKNSKGKRVYKLAKTTIKNDKTVFAVAKTSSTGVSLFTSKGSEFNSENLLNKNTNFIKGITYAVTPVDATSIDGKVTYKYIALPCKSLRFSQSSLATNGKTGIGTLLADTITKALTLSIRLRSGMNLSEVDKSIADQFEALGLDLSNDKQIADYVSSLTFARSDSRDLFKTIRDIYLSSTHSRHDEVTNGLTMINVTPKTIQFAKTDKFGFKITTITMYDEGAKFYTRRYGVSDLKETSTDKNYKELSIGMKDSNWESELRDVIMDSYIRSNTKLLNTSGTFSTPLVELDENGLVKGVKSSKDYSNYNEFLKENLATDFTDVADTAGKYHSTAFRAIIISEEVLKKNFNRQNKKHNLSEIADTIRMANAGRLSVKVTRAGKSFQLGYFCSVDSDEGLFSNFDTSSFKDNDTFKIAHDRAFDIISIANYNVKGYNTKNKTNLKLVNIQGNILIYKDGAKSFAVDLNLVHNPNNSFDDTLAKEVMSGLAKLKTEDDVQVIITDGYVQFIDKPLIENEKALMLEVDSPVEERDEPTIDSLPSGDIILDEDTLNLFADLKDIVYNNFKDDSEFSNTSVKDNVEILAKEQLLNVVDEDSNPVTYNSRVDVDSAKRKVLRQLDTKAFNVIVENSEVDGNIVYNLRIVENKTKSNFVIDEHTLRLVENSLQTNGILKDVRSVTQTDLVNWLSNVAYDKLAGDINGRFTIDEILTDPKALINSRLAEFKGKIAKFDAVIASIEADVKRKLKLDVLDPIQRKAQIDANVNFVLATNNLTDGLNTRNRLSIISKEMQLSLDNFDVIAKLVERDLASMGMIDINQIKREGDLPSLLQGNLAEAANSNVDTSLEEDAETEVKEDTSHYNYDTNLSINHKTTASKELKRFFKGIVKLNPNGTPSKNIFGENSYVNYNDVMEDLFSALAGTPRTFEQMLGIIKKNIDNKPYFKNVYDKLMEEYENDYSTIPAKFTKTMQKHEVVMDSLLVKRTKKGLFSTSIKSNKSSTVANIMNLWQNAFINTNFVMPVISDSSELFLNDNLLRDYVERYASLNTSNVLNDVNYSDKNAYMFVTKLIKSGNNMLYSLFGLDSISDYNSIMEAKETITESDLKSLLQKQGLSLETYNTIISIAKDPIRLNNIKRIYIGSFLAELGINVNQNALTSYLKGANSIKNLLDDFRTKHLKALIDGNKSIDLTDVNVFAPIYTVLKNIAKYEERYAIVQKESSYRDQAGKLVQTYAQFKYMFERLSAIKENDTYRQALMNTTMNRVHPFMRTLSSKIGNLELTYADSFVNKYINNTETKKLAEANPSELELFKLYDYMNGGSDFGNFLYPTLSDGKVIMKINYERRVYGINRKDGKFTSDLIKDYYESTIAPELTRIEEFIRKNPSINIKGFDKGATRLVLSPVMDAYINAGENSLVNQFTNDPNKKHIVTLTEDVKALLMKDLNEEVNNKVKKLADLGIFIKVPVTSMSTVNDVETETKTAVDPGDVVIDGFVYKYDISTIDTKFHALLESQGSNSVIGLVTNYVVSYRMAHSNNIALFLGDPATFWKKDHNTTNDNISKRLAGDRGPGELTMDYADPKAIYNQFTIADVEKGVVSVAKTFIDSVNSSFDYSDYNAADAQEMTSMYEDLKVRMNTGTISRGLFEALYDTEDGIVFNFLDSHVSFENGNIVYDGDALDYEDLILSSLKASDKTLYNEYVALVNQPVKPMYSNNEILSNNDFSADSRLYVKSSSYALRPNLTKDFQIDNLRKAMDITTAIYLKLLQTQGGIEKDLDLDTIQNMLKVSGRIDRVAFESAVKVGAPSGTLPNIFADGLSVNDVMASIKPASKVLNRSGFRLQQELPYSETKTAIKKGSQESKLLFNNLLEQEGFEEIKEEYDALYHSLYKYQADELVKSISPNGEIDYKKLKAMLDKEALSNNYNNNDFKGLDLNADGTEFLTPLFYHSRNRSIENLFTAIINNNVLKIKIPGRSYVLASEVGYKRVLTKVTEDTRSKIITTSKFDGELKAHGFRAKEDFADYVTGDYVKIDDIEGNKDKVYFQPDQVILPSYFRIDGKLVNLEAKENGKYVYLKDDANGNLVINEDMFDNDVLKLFGFRIPTQGHSSMASIEVVGFTRKSAGEFIIAPKDFVKRMGSDFDVDKLYTYMYNIKFDNNKFSKDTEGKKDILNKIVDTHHTVFSNPNKAVQEMILAPLSYGIFMNEDGNHFQSKSSIVNDAMKAEFGDNTPDISNFIDGLRSKAVTRSFLSDEYQHDFYKKGLSGKDGIAVFSVNSVFNAVAQSKKLEFGHTTKDGFESIDVIIGDSLAKGSEFYKAVGVNDRYKSLVISWYQSISVDNAKLNRMNKVNINSNTFNVINFLNQMGFDEEVVWLINQPIVVKYLQAVDDASSNLKSTFVNKMNIQNQIRKEFGSEKFKTDYGERATPRGIAQFGDDTFTIENMYKAIKDQNLYASTNSNVESSDRDDYNYRQLAILNAFLQYDKHGMAMSEIQQAINVDSKDVGAGFTDVIVKLNKQDKVVTTLSGQFKNAEKLIGNGSAKLDITSSAIQYGTKLTKELFSSMFIQFSKVFENAYNDLIGNAGLDASSNNIEKAINGLTDDIRRMAHVFSIANSLTDELGGKDVSVVQAVRYSLLSENYKFRGQSEDEKLNKVSNFNDRVNLRTSLPTLLLKIQDTPYGKTNRFIMNMMAKVSKTNHELSKITYNNTRDNSISDGAIYADLLDLLNTNPTFNFDGKLYSGRQLFSDLLVYSKVTGGIQRFSDFVKFIPVEVERAMGVSDSLKEFDTLLPELLTDFTYTEFYRQFVQHHPEWAHQVKLTAYKSAADSSNTMYTMYDVDSKATLDVSKAAALNVKADCTSAVTSKTLVKSKDGKLEAPYRFLTHKTKAGDYILYEQTGLNDDSKEVTYTRIDTLGTHGSIEYDPYFVKDITSTREPIKSSVFGDAKRLLEAKIDKVVPDDMLNKAQKVFGYKVNNVKEAMHNIANVHPDRFVSYFARHFLRNVNASKIKMPILISSSEVDQAFLSDSDNAKSVARNVSGMVNIKTSYQNQEVSYIVYNSEWIERNDVTVAEIQKELIHEIGHTVLNDTYIKGVMGLVAKGLYSVDTNDTLNKDTRKVAYEISNGSLDFTINKSLYNSFDLGKLTTEEMFVLNMATCLDNAREFNDNNGTTKLAELKTSYASGVMSAEDKVLQGLVNPLEFIAELTSNSDFVKYLDKVTYGNTSMVAKAHNSVFSVIRTMIMDILNKIFGFKLKHNNVAEVAVSNVMLVMEKNTPTSFIKAKDTSIPGVVSEQYKDNIAKEQAARIKEAELLFPEPELIGSDGELNLDLFSSTTIRNLINDVDTEIILNRLVKEDRLNIACKL